MRTILSNSPVARGCTIVSLLVCVRALPAANAVRSPTTLQNRTSAYAEAGPGDPCAVGPRVQTNSLGSKPSATTVPLAQLLSRTRSRAKTSRSADAGSPVETPYAGPEQNGPFTQELWSSRITAPQTGQEAEDSLALRRLIRQVRSVKFHDKDPGPTFTPPAESPARPHANEAPPVPANATAPAATATSAPASTASEPATTLPAQARKTLATLQQNPSQVGDPLEMAELLFLSGRPTEAAPFYAKALDRISRLDPSYDADRAWILFQLGNCLRETDGAKAQETYMKLISEYPDSPWTELAKAHGRLLTWYQKDASGQAGALSQL